MRGGLGVRRWGVGLRWLAADQDDAVRRIHDAVGVDAIHFESGYPKLV